MYTLSATMIKGDLKRNLTMNNLKVTYILMQMQSHCWKLRRPREWIMLSQQKVLARSTLLSSQVMENPLSDKCSLTLGCPLCQKLHLQN